jgi:hypothetical protein
MPRCYLLAVAKSSALDESTNSWSLFNLVEQLQIGGLTEEQIAEARPVLPFEIHAQWEFEDEEMGTPFEFKVSIGVQGQEPLESHLVEIHSDNRRHRVRMTGVPVPGVGRGQVKVLWRSTGDADWTVESLAWPLEVSLKASDAEIQLPLDA